MLAAKTGAKAKDRVNGFRKGCSAPTAADSIHEIGNGLMELMNCSSGLSKQKHRSVYACSSRVGYTILFHLEYVLSTRGDFISRSLLVQPVLRLFGTRFDRQDKVWVGAVEEPSVLAAEQACRAKDRLTKESERVPGYKRVIHIKVLGWKWDL